MQINTSVISRYHIIIITEKQQ